MKAQQTAAKLVVCAQCWCMQMPGKYTVQDDGPCCAKAAGLINGGEGGTPC